MEFHHHAVEGVRFAEINWPIIAGGSVDGVSIYVDLNLYIVLAAIS